MKKLQKKIRKHYNQFCLKTIFVNMNSLWIANPLPKNNSLIDLIMEFYKIWPPFQWITSLATLIVMYWVSGYYYNKFLAQKSGSWMDVKTRIVMILLDLFLNFSLGIYYMNYRETFLGTLMLRCPVFCSPIFWLLELICFYIYYKYLIHFRKK